MRDFLDRLRRLRREAGEEGRRQARQDYDAASSTRHTSMRVDRVADRIEKHIEARLAEFREEFVEFRYESYTREGRRFRIYWDEPLVGEDGRSNNHFHQLSFQVRRYHEYADVEVTAKTIVRNRDRHRRVVEVDVREDKPERLEDFVERMILEFTRLYTYPEGAEGSE